MQIRKYPFSQMKEPQRVVLDCGDKRVSLRLRSEKTENKKEILCEIGELDSFVSASPLARGIGIFESLDLETILPDLATIINDTQYSLEESLNFIKTDLGIEMYLIRGGNL